MFDYFYNIAKYLPEGSLMIFNNTGVIPARVTFKKDTGGKVNGLILVNEGYDDDDNVPVIVDEQIFSGRRLYLLDEYEFTISYQVEQKFYLKPEFDRDLLPSILEKCGTTPVPFYLGKQELDEKDLRTRYQTIFAKEKKSVAAPTASLHFSKRVFESLKDTNIVTKEITLDVGLGTFQEVEEKNIEGKYLHYEKFFISEDTTKEINHYKHDAKKIIAVGTTTVRALESQADNIINKEGDIVGETNIFIMPPYTFKIVDHLVTNFHVPQSSLMALVDAFLQYKKSKKTLLELYDIAQKEDYKFYSFGDSMLIL
jgi:S-adenosylmethionine:tRNA ribosyltransferase-isomerase